MRWDASGENCHRLNNRLRPRERRERKSMELWTKMCVKANEALIKGWRKGARGQTMTEYALILAAVAIVAYVTYQVMGQDIGSMVNKIDSALSAA